MQYNFKKIVIVPNAKDFIDIMLSKTQRKTPTVIHKHFKIGRIRQFYMRKIKFTQQNIHDKLTQIIQEFPKLEEIHPFYSDLMNVLYDKNHYKLALGQLNAARHLVDNVGRDYVRLLKFADSLYRCKCLKRAALGRMCTIIKRQAASLDYLEQVRQHLSRLPSIDPTTRTILVCGFPNVGKSSFVNKITNADVEVQPYAFTTKCLYVGHTDYNYLRWQVIDTPGILDHPLEERNTIEMQAITALAHIKAVVLFLIDITEECGYSCRQQVDLYENIKVLFQHKPLMIVASKTDIMKICELPEERKHLLENFIKQGIPVLEMSSYNEEGIMDVRNQACEMLLNYRLEQKMQGKLVHQIQNRLHTAEPVPRDDKIRPPFIPEAIRNRMSGVGMETEPVKLEKDLEDELGDDYILDLRKNWLLDNPDEKYDKIPEIWNGHNVADFIDPDIEKRLRDLEIEETLLEEGGFYDNNMSEDDDETKEILGLGQKIRNKRLLMIQQSRFKRRMRKAKLPRPARAASRHELVTQMEDLGLDLNQNETPHYGKVSRRVKSKSLLKSGVKRLQSATGLRPLQKIPRDQLGVKDVVMLTKATKLARIQQRQFQFQGKCGESDRRIYSKMPKHLFSGKRKIGKTDRR